MTVIVKDTIIRVTITKDELEEMIETVSTIFIEAPIADGTYNTVKPQLLMKELAVKISFVFMISLVCPTQSEGAVVVDRHN